MFRIDEKRAGDIITLQTSGQMLDEDSRILSEKVKGLVASGAHKIVIDLGKINLMNSCFGLGVLAACWGYMNRENGKLVLANPSQKVKRILEITKLNQVFDIFPTVDEAIRYFK
jgi:anti-sigma B factor antagonist